jgi:DNA-binding transcriptional ArsR family regulator
MVNTGKVQALHSAKVRRVAKTMLADAVVTDLSETFKVLGNPTRLKLIHALFDEELCVGDLAVLLEMTDSAVSHQLRLLRGMRLVRYRKEGKQVYYTLDDQHVHQLFKAALDHQHE